MTENKRNKKIGLIICFFLSFVGLIIGLAYAVFTFNKLSLNGNTFSKGIDVPNDYRDIMSSQHFVYGLAQNLTVNTYTREGYEFKSWNTMPDGSGITYTDEQLVNNLTTVDGDEVNLYAQWEANAI